MRHTVGVADMKVVKTPGDIVVTHALGSCIGIAVHDPVAKVGGLLHVMLPQSTMNPAKALANPCMFMDTGLSAFFHTVYATGGVKERLVVKVAGGANVQGLESDRFAIGKRNCIMMKKLFWKNGILTKSEDTGGTHARTMYLEIGSGRCWLSTAGQETEL